MRHLGARDALERILRARREGRLGAAIRRRTLPLELAVWRRLLGRVVFIAVTGSCGKTTTKELAAAVLATRLSGRRTSDELKDIEETILRTRPWDDFCLVEMAIADVDGTLMFDSSLRQIRPRIGVVTVIGTDHLGIYRTPEALAAQKGNLIESLPRDGIAVLNADDPLVRDMRRRCRGRVITYGVAEDAVLRAADIRARWPEPLSFTVHHEGRSLEVRTRLYGAHHVPNVLAALTVGLAMGIPLGEAVAAVGAVSPVDKRLSPLAHPDGFTVVRDDIKAPLGSIPAALRFLEEARAQRKVLVLGTISDYAGASGPTYVAVARQALEVADEVVFVGNASAKSLKARRGAGDEALQAFYSPEAAGEHLRGTLRPGDLVLVKGSAVDRLQDLVTALMRPRGVADERQAEARAPDAAGRFQVVVGLGNPGPEREDTPHNVGHRVLDLLARTLGAEWSQEVDARVATVEGDGQTVHLVKPAARMNETGPALLAIARRMGFGARDCILVHDDVDLPIRSVRVRMRSGDGGHRGVRSVLQTLRTDEVRRVRVGVGRPEDGQAVMEYVLTPFGLEELAVIDEASAEAADRVLELLGRRERIRGRTARGRGAGA